MSDLLSKMTDLDELKRLLSAREAGASTDLPPEEIAAALKARVKGQDHVIDDLAKFVSERFAVLERDRPIASIVLLGPTGTGKTELAKALTEFLYDKEDNMIRIDGADCTDQSCKASLIGSDGVWKGATPGRLTQPVINNPRRVILFDEIEKAWPGIYDLFLTMMGEGRLTDQNTGRVANYTQSIIILTSNIEHEAIGRIQEQIDDPDEMNNAVKNHLRDVKAFRAEIVGRFDRVYVFKPLEGLVLAEIAVLKMQKVAKKGHGLELTQVHPSLILAALERSEKIKDFGVRELDRIVEEIMSEPCRAARRSGIHRIALDVDPATGELVVNQVE
ncbi:MAG: ATP-dependent Clp protease ATP-binding subunit [Phycisphaerales bacterium]|nr:ATP-dependent Clp protease ATP-binding subunit [Phycisphaerales bacterium]